MNSSDCTGYIQTGEQLMQSVSTSGHFELVRHSPVWRSYPWYFQHEAKVVDGVLKVRLHAECGADISKHKITVFLGDEFDESRLPFFFNNRILPISNLFNESLTFHAGAVAFDNKAFIFLGNSGVGKSTTVLKCLQAGAQLIAEDMVTIGLRTGEPVALRGPAWMRLCRDAFVTCNAASMDDMTWHFQEGKHLGLVSANRCVSKTATRVCRIVELSKFDEPARVISYDEFMKRLMSSMRYGRIAFKEFGASTWNVLNALTKIDSLLLPRNQLDVRSIPSYIS